MKTALWSSLLILALLSPSLSEVNASEKSGKAEKIYNNYQKAKEDNDQVRALEYIIEYTRFTKGDETSEVIKPLYLHGKLLLKQKKYRDALDSLLEASNLEQQYPGSISASELANLHMDIANAYTFKKRGILAKALLHFDLALKALRDNQEHETLRYVNTLVAIVSDLIRSELLNGDLMESIVNAQDVNDENIIYDGSFSVEGRFESYFSIAEKYLDEASHLARKLKVEDEYLTSKISIARAKLKLIETGVMSNVQPGVEGYITDKTIRENYQREDDRLKVAIMDLLNDRESNEQYLMIANQTRMEIAWKNKDEQQMLAMCKENLYDMSDKYPSYRLYDISEGGFVHAPDLNLRVSKNIFRKLVELPRETKKGKSRRRKPYFIPVCIGGELMAALINAPVVLVKETN